MADRKIFEFSVFVDETDHRVYHDGTITDLKTEEELLQVITTLNEMQSGIIAKYLELKGINSGDRDLRSN